MLKPITTVSHTQPQLSPQFDGGKVTIPVAKMTAESLKEFIASNRLPILIEFTQEIAPKVFGGEIKSHNLLFISKKDENLEATLEEYRKVAPAYKGKVCGFCVLLLLIFNVYCDTKA